MCSLGDLTGVTPEGQKGLYDEAVKKKPSTLLFLEQEVYGMFRFTFSPPYQREFFWMNVTLVVFRHQRLNLFPCFSFLLFDTKTMFLQASSPFTS